MISFSVVVDVFMDIHLKGGDVRAMKDENDLIDQVEIFNSPFR
jgi:hypothetical protein